MDFSLETGHYSRNMFFAECFPSFPASFSVAIYDGGLFCELAKQMCVCFGFCADTAWLEA